MAEGLPDFKSFAEHDFWCNRPGQGGEGSQIQFGTLRALLQRRGERNPSSRDYDRMRRDIDVLRGYDFHCKNAFWDVRRRSYVDMNWRLFGSVFYFRPSLDGDDEHPFGFLEVSPVLQQVAKRRGFFALGFSNRLFYSLKPLEQRLAVYLAKKFASQQTHRRYVEDLEQAVVDDLARMRLATPELADWFRTELRAAVTDLTVYRRQQSKSLAKRKTELAAMQDRLLNAYLAGTVEEAVYKSKSTELKTEVAKADESLAQSGDVDPARAETALALFDWTQNASEIWRGSNNRVRREILDAVCLNRTLTDVNLDATKRKPFDVFAKGLEIKNSRGDRTSIELFSGSLSQWTKSLIVIAQALAS
jgi:hypothetical protein